jgi:hypothetical protein
LGYPPCARSYPILLLTGLAQVQEIPSPAGARSGQPNLTVSRDGKVYLSWIERLPEGRFSLRFARQTGDGWSAPRVIAEGSDWFVNWADFPSMVVLTTVLHVIGKQIEDPNQPRNLLTPTEVEKREQERIIPCDVVSLYDGGVMQRIESFSPDPTPAHIVLPDNSSTLRTNLRKLASVPAAFAPEIYEGDQVMVIGVGAPLPLVSGDETGSEVIASPSALAHRRSP